MKHILIVGQGIAGTAIGFRLMQRNLNVTWIDNQNLSNASRIASGLYNPIVLKRMRLVHLADAFNEQIYSFYKSLESFTKNTFFYPKPIYRVLHSIEEQNNWYQLSENPKWSTMLGDIVNDNNIKAPFGLGTVQQTGWVDTANMIASFRERIKDKVLDHVFVPQHLEHKNNGYEYRGVYYDAVVFAEGWKAAKDNPYYPKDAFRPSKGELLTLKLDDRDTPNRIFHFKHFLIPLRDGQTYRTGATYVHGDLSETPTEKSRIEMLESLKTIYSGKTEVIKQDVGIRAATKDRKPMVGRHPLHKNIYFLNGLGSRSILMAPYLSHLLTEQMLNNGDIEPSIDISRFF